MQVHIAGRMPIWDSLPASHPSYGEVCQTYIHTIYLFYAGLRDIIRSMGQLSLHCWSDIIMGQSASNPSLLWGRMPGLYSSHDGQTGQKACSILPLPGQSERSQSSTLPIPDQLDMSRGSTLQVPDQSTSPEGSIHPPLVSQTGY